MKNRIKSSNSPTNNSLTLDAKGKKAAVLSVFVLVLLSVIMLFSSRVLADGQKKSEPLTTHEPQTYVFDYNQPNGSRLTTEDGRNIVGSGRRSEWDWLPILLPGDKVKIIPELPSVDYALEHGKTSVGVVGLVFMDKTSATKEPSFKVTKEVAYGTAGNENHGNTFIQEFEITGTEPVMVVVNGGTSGYTREKKTVWVNETEVEVTLAYGAGWLGFVRFPEYIDFNYQFWDVNVEDETWMEDFEAVYYGETENPDAIWAVDAIYNLDELGNGTDKATFKINRPYAEGYEIVFNDIYRSSKAYNWPIYGEFDESDTKTIIPRWGATSRTIGQGEEFTLVGSYTEDWINVRYDCYFGRTLTLDACGGTINGFESRIYEMSQYSPLYRSLEDDEAAGKYIPVREGYKFDGWYADKNYTEKVESLKIVLDKYSDTSEKLEERICRLYAKWVVDLRGWQEIDGDWYYFDDNGEKVTGWKRIGNWYYFDDDGVMQTGWIKDSGYWYYLRSSGAMHTGWLLSGSTWYYLKPSGEMATGWAKVGGIWYYFSGSGAMQTGWIKSGGIWYYLQPSGAMKTGWLLSGGKWYYLEASGAMVTGWKTVGGYTYYFDENGAMVTGIVTIDGKRYRFDNDGHCLNP